MDRKLLIGVALALMLLLAGCVGPKGGAENDVKEETKNSDIYRVAYPEDGVVCYVFHPYSGGDGGGISCVPMESNTSEGSYYD